MITQLNEVCSVNWMDDCKGWIGNDGEGVMICEILGSHGGEYEDGCILGHCAV
jgi:hypothetical protein